MSEENVEVLRKAYESAESRGVEGLLNFATEDLAAPTIVVSGQHHDPNASLAQIRERGQHAERGPRDDPAGYAGSYSRGYRLAHE